MIMKLAGCAPASSFAAAEGAAMACKCRAGQTPFVDYAQWRYGRDGVVVADLPGEGI